MTDDEHYTRARWLAVYGAMVALQCRDYMAERGVVNIEEMESFVELASDIADLAHDVQQARTERGEETP